MAFPAPLAAGDRPAAAASKLRVGPGLLEAAFKTGMRKVYANHWVIAAGEECVHVCHRGCAQDNAF
jgi:hypothetical protein